MKNKRRLLKILSLLTLSVFFFMGVASCTTSMSQGRPTGMSEQDVKRFVGKIRVRPGSADSHYLLGCYYQERGRHREAIAEFEKVIVIDPSYVKAYNGKGISHDRLGDYAQAADGYRQALSLDPQLDYAWNNLGYSHILRGDYVAAVDAFRKALELNDKEPMTRNNLARALAMTGDYEQALREFERVGGNDGSSPHLKMAAVYFEKAMFRQAMESYQAALALDPSSIGAKRGIEASRKLLVIAAAAAAHKEKPAVGSALPPEENTVASARIGVIAATPDNAPKARENYQTAVRFYEKGDFNEAKKYFAIAVTQNPSSVSARKGLIASESLARIAEAPSVVKDRSAALKAVAKTAKRASLQNNVIGIEISNGNGARHMARNLAKYLRTKGFTVVRLTNARHFNYARGSIIFEKEYEKQATDIASAIPHIKDMKTTARLDRANVKVKILMGKNMLAHRLDYQVREN